MKDVEKTYSAGDNFITERGTRLLFCNVSLTYQKRDDQHIPYFSYCLVVLAGGDIGNRWTNAFQSTKTRFTLNELHEFSKSKKHLQTCRLIG